MASDPIRTLLLPFENGEVVASRADRALFLRAEPHPALLQRGGAIDWRASLACVQSFKPTYDSLAAQGFAVTPEAPVGGSFDLVLVRLTRHKLESLGLIAEGLGALKVGGTLAVAGAKDEGIESVEKRVKALLGPVASRSKHHARSFHLTRQDGPLPDDGKRLGRCTEARRPHRRLCDGARHVLVRPSRSRLAAPRHASAR